MRTKWLMALGILLTIWAVIYFSMQSRLVETITSDVFDLALIILVGGGSIYKLRLWWRYRHDPAKREAIASSTGFYPTRLRKFFYDE